MYHCSLVVPWKRMDTTFYSIFQTQHFFRVVLNSMQTLACPTHDECNTRATYALDEPDKREAQEPAITLICTRDERSTGMHMKQGLGMLWDSQAMGRRRARSSHDHSRILLAAVVPVTPLRCHLALFLHGISAIQRQAHFKPVCQPQLHSPATPPITNSPTDSTDAAESTAADGTASLAGTMYRFV